jgi:hypothetical protein
MNYGDIADIIIRRAKFKGFWIEGILARSGFGFLSLLWRAATAVGAFSFIKKFVLKCS